MVYLAIDRANLADSTKAQYRKAIDKYIATGNRINDASALAEYAQDLKKSSRAFLKAAIRLVSDEIATSMKGHATPDNVRHIQAGLYRLDAMNKAIKVSPDKGIKTHVWLLPVQVKELMATCEDDLVGRRDWIVLGLLVGAGLRRTELVTLRFEDLKEQPRKNGKMRPVLAIKGKGAKNRTIPISDKLAQAIRDWGELLGFQGFIARSLGRKKVVGDSLSQIGVFNIARKHGAMIGIPELAPHDLRRTYAQLGYEAGIPITQISKLLGHANIAVTQRYLNLDLNLEETISDFIPL
jgi:integrase